MAARGLLGFHSNITLYEFALYKAELLSCVNKLVYAKINFKMRFVGSDSVFCLCTYPQH